MINKNLQLRKESIRKIEESLNNSNKIQNRIIGIIKNNKDEILVLKYTKYNSLILPNANLYEDETIEDCLYTGVFKNVDIEIENYNNLKSIRKMYNIDGNIIEVMYSIFETDIKGDIMSRNKYIELEWMSIEGIKSLTTISDIIKLYLECVSV